MNSLTYISRQFDVLASPRAPPSTPTSEPDELAHNLKRVKTWSRSLSRGPAPHDAGALKRSLSSPPGFVLSATPHARRRALSPSSAGKQPRPPTDGVTYAFRRIYLVRVLAVLWNGVCAAWVALTGRATRARGKPKGPAAVEEGVETDVEKDSSEDEASGSDKGGTLYLQLHSSSSSPGYSITSSPPRNPAIISIKRDLHRTVSEPPIASETAPQTPSPGSGTHTPSSSQSHITRKTPFHLPKTLVLDLDETLIHSTSRPFHYPDSKRSGLLGLIGSGKKNKGASHMVEVVLGGRRTCYHVYKRPFVDYFLRKVSGWYTLVIFTASMKEYADPVIDWLDAGTGILGRRFFRESCTQLANGSYSKDLSIVEQDLSRVCLLDNSPVCYSLNQPNGIPIEGWTHDPSDEALLDLLPVLDSLRFTSDVRRVLGIRGFSA